MRDDQHSDRINNATRVISDNAVCVIDTRFRQNYHFMAPSGWINDPNGLIKYKGEYHLFYQHNPYSASWGAMHWGHAVSSDMVKWRILPIALAPSESYDNHENGGCFSGSAVDDNGILSLIYTGTSNDGNQYIQSQCLATSTDGINFSKYKGNPVISAPPANGSNDFRDPKVWSHEGKWYMVTGSCKNGRGKALLYQSTDLKKWDYVNVLAESRGELGTMWECPDFFPVGDKYVLMFSPMGLYDRKSVYLTGKMDYKTGRFFWSTIGETDWGYDFYAPQSFLDDDGRRIIIGWANSWDWMPWWKDFGPTQKDGWCGAMSLPRTVSLCLDGKLSFEPVEELKSLREDCYSISNLVLQDGVPVQLRAGNGTSYEIEAEFDLKKSSASLIGFALRCSENEKTIVECDLKAGELIFDRSHSDNYSNGVRRCLLESASSDTLKLHIFVDTCSVEIFTDGGRTVLSANIFPSSGSIDLFVYAKNGNAKICKLSSWGMKSIWK